MDGFEIYHEEYLKPLRITLYTLARAHVRFSGPDVSFLTRYRNYFYMIPMVTLHFMSLSAYIVQLFTEGKDPFENAYMIPMWLIFIEYWIKLAILLIKRESIREVIKELGSMFRTTGLNEEQTRMKDSALKHLYYGGLIFNKTGITVSWQYLLVPLCETVVRRVILQQDVELLLPFACVYPFEITNWPIYLGVYAFQVYSIFYAAYLYLGVGWLLVVLTTHINIQFLLLQEDLIHMKPERVANQTPYLSEDIEDIKPYRDIPDMSIGHFVRRHQKLMLVTDKLNGACNKLTFTIMLFATLVICFFAVAAKASTGAVQALNNYGAIVVIMMNIFVLCYCSELLTLSSSGIALAAAKNLWYKGDLHYQTKMRFIIMRSQKPCALTSLDFSPIGLGTFNKVLKTTWSYFSLASQMYDERD